MALRQLSVCILTAFVTIPGSGALKMDQEPTFKKLGLNSLNVGKYEADPEFKQRGLTFSAQSVEKVLKSTNDVHQIQITLKNDGSKPLTFLNWGSPFEEKISNRIFRSQPETSSYLGYIVNRKAGTNDIPEKALTTVQPGTELTATVDLNQLMAFHEKTHYSVLVNFALLMIDDHQEKLKRGKLTASDTIQQWMETSVDLDVEGVRSQDDVLRRFEKAGPGGCDSSQKAIVDAATTVAQKMINDAIHNINTQADAAMYASWLGNNTENPLWANRITDRYDHMLKTVLDIYSPDQVGSGYLPDCAACSSEMGWQYDMVYAYVYPTDSTKRVHMCGVFWRAPTTKLVRDSQPGTIIHELSHFADQFGTSDVAYGTTAIQGLARSEPGRARDNADNIEAYAEYVPCPGPAAGRC